MLRRLTSACLSDAATKSHMTYVDLRIRREEADRERLRALFASFGEGQEDPRFLVKRMNERKWIARLRDARRRMRASLLRRPIPPGSR